MFTSNSITLENSEKIIVVGKESGLAFFGALFALVFWLCIAIYNLNLFTIIVSAGIGLFTLFLFYQPKEIVSEFDLNKRKVFISKTHFILNFSVEEIRFEDIESIEVETHGGGSSGMKKNHLIVNLKDQPVGEDLGRVPRVEELQKKLKRFIGLPD